MKSTRKKIINRSRRFFLARTLELDHNGTHHRRTPKPHWWPLWQGVEHIVQMRQEEATTASAARAEGGRTVRIDGEKVGQVTQKGFDVHHSSNELEMAPASLPVWPKKRNPSLYTDPPISLLFTSPLSEDADGQSSHQWMAQRGAPPGLVSVGGEVVLAQHR